MEAPVGEGAEQSPAGWRERLPRLINPGTGGVALVVAGLGVTLTGVLGAPQPPPTTPPPAPTTTAVSPSPPTATGDLDPMWRAVEHLEAAYGETVSTQELAEAALAALVEASNRELGTPTSSEEVPDEVAAGFEEFWHAWRSLEREGMEAEPRDLMVAAIEAMVEATNDPEAAVLVDVSVEADGYVEDAYHGIGAFVSPVDDRIVIGQPFPGGPASNAGIRPGDVLVEVDGVSVVGMPIDQVVSLVRGPAGTTVSLVLERAGVDAVEVEVVREALELSTSRFNLHPGGIGYLSVSSFEGRTPAEVEDQLQQLLLRDIRALILDLRGNPGGRPSAALAVADHFLDGEVVYLEEGLDGTSTPHRASEGGMVADIPVAILIDQSTAGEAEMLAAALRTHQRGPLLGLRTGGRSALHRGWEVGDGIVVVVRSGRWLTPNQGDVDPSGLPPDQEVGLSAEDVASGFDRPQATANAYLWTLLEGELGDAAG